MNDRFDPIAKIAKVRTPLSMLHGERDRVVPIRVGRKLFAAASDPKEVVFLPNAGHNDLPARGNSQAVTEFLERQFPR